MKGFTLSVFFGLLLISSCTCNDNNDTADGTNTDTTSATTTTPIDAPAADGTANGQTGNDAVNDERYRRMFNLQGYTDEQVREYRRLHDEMDWGGVPGFYPEGSTRPLTEEDTRYLTKWGHKVMLNEIYARHGMTFDDPDLKEHFTGFGWYSPSSANVNSKLTAQEKENIAFLNSHPAQ